MKTDQEYLTILLQGLVKHPHDVTVTRSVDDLGVLLSVKVNPSDMGNVIGREGETAKSVRHLLRIHGMNNTGERTTVKILEPEQSSYRRHNADV